MQLNIFAKAAPLLKEQKFDIDVDKFIKFMGHYHPEDWVYPSAIHRNLKIDIRTVYEILGLLDSKKYVESYLQIDCPNCQKFTGFTYRSIGDIPQVLSCTNCDFEIVDPLKHAVLIYKVL
ncbi:hypothetical protein [Lactobacillus gallinarum]|uniref:Uncharacterized protein n=1 Tax=Lactobacillus gallinarum TaxID=52242 RepID=A0A1Y4VVX9_9LACO|nr:hypothetical protein [Lactobacillus gallinarum]OUQ56300.1 hypothetical protein B5E59_05345 [Lactobacillus gallinarum]OUQ74289.1 hypothetical protein B5E44_10125 [Lactobacillus gallinarum]